MIHEYIESALRHSHNGSSKSYHYEIIEDEEPYYGEVPELQWVWATGKSLPKAYSGRMPPEPG